MRANLKADVPPGGLVLSSSRFRVLDWLAEKVIFLVSLTAILMVLLIFVFVAKEAVPIVLGWVDNSARQTPPLTGDPRSLPEQTLTDYLGLSAAELRSLDPAVLALLLEVRAEEYAAGVDHPEARLNTVAWRYLVPPHQWEGYDRPDYVWQPAPPVPKYNIVPLLIGSLKTTLVALVFAVPLALGAAIYVSQIASPRARELLKPTIELLAGVPSVILGFFALIVLASLLQSAFGYVTRLNAFVAGLALGFAIIPIIFSIAEDALTTVPRSYTRAALALGASRWQAAWKVVLPAALPGVFAAVVLGFGRAIGETMIVLMASGNASLMSSSVFESARTLTATIAAELAETVFGGPHYKVLFLLGTLLLGLTFVSNLVGDLILNRLKYRLEGRR